MRQPDNRHSALLQFFTAHPASVGENYRQHFMFAARFSARLLAASAAAMLHAIVPAWFETTASDQIRALQRDIDGRHSEP